MVKANERIKQITEGVTFRIPSIILNKLKDESETKRISLNTFANQIFKEHLEWHSQTSHANLFYTPGPFTIRLINELSDDQIIRIAKDTAKKDLVDIMLVLTGKVGFESLLEVLENWSRIDSSPIKHVKDERSHTIITQHNAGGRYSLFSQQVFRTLFEEVLELKADIKVTDNTIILKVNKD
jgi:hypothetical protein